MLMKKRRTFEKTFEIIEGKNEQQLELIKNQGEKQLNLINNSNLEKESKQLEIQSYLNSSKKTNG